MAHPIARLTQTGILAPSHGVLQPTEGFLAHLSMFRHSGRVHQWDLRSLVEQALSTWEGNIGDAREASRHLVPFLPGAALPMAAFPVLDAFVAA